MRGTRSGSGVGLGRHAGLALVALLLALSGALAPAGATTVRAAEDGLGLTTATTYTVVPARQLVRVVMDVTARNSKPNTTAGGIVTRYYYDSARFAIQPEARNVRATAAGARLVATTKAQDGFAILDVRFRSNLFFGQSTKLRVTYDLPGGAPRSASEIRVGKAFATFTAWAFGDGGSVRIVIPEGFDATTSGSTTTRSTSGGATVLRATGITDITDWYVVVVADRKSALLAERLALAGVQIVVRGWPEDPEWRREVADLLTNGLPRLVAETGSAWPVDGELEVFEVHTPLLEGYAGVFFQGENRIEISEDLDELTILHEASHAWFNGGLFSGRWINEGFADTYAARALDAIGIGGWVPNDVDPGAAAAIPLETWEHPGRIDDEETDAREQYGYEASWTVIRALVGEIGGEPMRRVLAAARERTIPYVGAGTPEALPGVPDWRRLLDLLEETGGSRTASDVFRRWVLTDAQIDGLAERSAARDAYAGLARRGGDWLPPFYVRDPMAAWRFPTATQRIAEAEAVLADRDALVTLTSQLGVGLPATLRPAYETARSSLADVEVLVDAHVAAGRALVAADAAVDAPRDPVVSLGLLGSAPEADLAAAVSLFGTGSAAAATDAELRAAALTALIAGAAEFGRTRLLTGLVVLAVVVLAMAVAFALVVRRRRRRDRDRASVAPATEAALAAASTSVAAAPYGTLADQSSAPDTGPGGPAESADATGAFPQPPPVTGDDIVSQQD